MSNDVKNNNLFPVFLKLEHIPVVLIGGGNVALEKINAILANSPKTKITLVAREISEALKSIINSGEYNINVINDVYKKNHLIQGSIVISAVNDVQLSRQIKIDANELGVLYNAADKPEICDFYLSSIVTKGNLKIAISTNGKSPTLAKRLKEIFNENIPESVNESLDNLSIIRDHLKGDFQYKVDELNKITAQLKEKTPKKWFKLNLKTLLVYVLSVLLIMISGHIVFSYIPYGAAYSQLGVMYNSLGTDFLYFMLGGFIAQMIDGALGMAYGLSATTFLLSLGVSPAVSSMAVHTSEIFTSGVSGFMHLRFGNVNNKLFKTILIPGVIGSILGAYILSEFEKYNTFIKPLVGCYTLILGVIIVLKVVRKLNKRKRVKHVGWLATAGGFLDAIGGGGWGPVVSSTLIARGKNPRIIIGSVNLAEFFVSAASSFTFITLIGLSNWQVILGLILGGVCAAPIAAYLSRKLNVKAMMILVGVIAIIVSIRNILKGIL